jgi:hypothetical protein
MVVPGKPVNSAGHHHRKSRNSSRKEMVTFGIEDFEYDSKEIDEVHNVLKSASLAPQVLKGIMEEVARNKEREAALLHRKELANVSGFVATHADFVTRRLEEDWTLTLQHPLNEFLGEHPNTYIKIVCNPEFLTPSGRNAFANGASVRITCFGKIIRWDAQSRQLIISPIGIS